MKRISTPKIISLSLVTLAIAGCGGGGGGGKDMLAAQCMPTTVSCTDQQVSDLALFATVNMATVDNTADGGGWVSHIDATAGGLTPTKSFVYAKFTDTGLLRVDISDEAAFNSMDWDIAFRRFVIRLNSGISGPSCVTAARTAANTDYAALSSVPTGLEYRTEEYYSTPDCTLIPDGSGLGSPGTALQSFWMYQSCVQMTGNVFVVKTRDGKQLKLQVRDYYSPTVQDKCNADGQQPAGASGAGNLIVAWELLP